MNIKSHNYRSYKHIQFTNLTITGKVAVETFFREVEDSAQQHLTEDCQCRLEVGCWLLAAQKGLVSTVRNKNVMANR
jgi:hypothetical protein